MDDWMDDFEVLELTFGALTVEEKQRGEVDRHVDTVLQLAWKRNVLVQWLRLGAEGGRGRVIQGGYLQHASERDSGGRKGAEPGQTWKLELVKAIYSPVVEFNLRVGGTVCYNAAAGLFSLDFSLRGIIGTLAYSLVAGPPAM
jgi:hypothetical protein